MVDNGYYLEQDVSVNSWAANYYAATEDVDWEQ